jgi:hypothetical protein
VWEEETLDTRQGAFDTGRAKHLLLTGALLNMDALTGRLGPPEFGCSCTCASWADIALAPAAEDRAFLWPGITIV